ncbi:MAG: hypothetical protein JNJ83_10990 [Verrucomicrobiaceae bacterium]|nr:hypothetical protein [Verrucomicrobiaceae bacterium]
MYLSFVKAIERKSGKLKTLVEIATVTYDQSKLGKVLDAMNAFDAPTKEGAALRSSYSHMQCVLTNTLRCNREFADVDAALLQAEREAAAEAERQAMLKAQADVEAARAALEKAKADLVAVGGSPEEVSPEIKASFDALQKERDELLAKLEAATAAQQGSQVPPESVTEGEVAAASVPTGSESSPPPPPDE